MHKTYEPAHVVQQAIGVARVAFRLCRLPISGAEFVVAVRGFLCKLCKKFYQDETAARLNHCRSKSHIVRCQVRRIQLARKFDETAQTRAARRRVLCKWREICLNSLDRNGRSPIWEGFDSNLYSHTWHLNGCSSLLEGLD